MSKYQDQVLEVAKSYYDAGCNIIPVKHGTKKAEVNWKEYQDKRPSRKQVEAWFSDGIDHNIAMICGRTSSSVAICFNDSEVYKRFFGDIDPLKSTRVHSSSRGYHIFIKTDERVGLLLTQDQNIEIRGDGGYILIPPSLHPSGVNYRSLNPETPINFVPDFWEWVEERCLAAGYLLVDKKFVRMPEDIQKYLKGPIKHPEREPALFRIACYLAEFWPDDKEKVRAKVHLVNQMALDPPRERDVVDKKVENAFKKEYVQDRGKKQKQWLREEKERTTPISFKELEDGGLAEIVYDSDKQQTKLAIYRNGEVSYVDRVEDRGKILVPLPQAGSSIQKGAVKVPSAVEEYESKEKLINDLQSCIHKYIQLPSTQYERFVAYYILMTWVYDRFSALPYLRFTGGFSSGKTRAESVIGSLVYKGIYLGGGITTSPLFRMMDLWQGTLVIDEAEFKYGTDVYDSILQVLNVGDQREGGYVTRSERGVKENYLPTHFTAYGPKILASRTGTEVATESRMITITMSPLTRAKGKDAIPVVLPDGFRRESLRLRDQLLKYRFDNYYALTPRVNEDIPNPRLRQKLIPIWTLCKGDKEIERWLPKLAKEYHEDMMVAKGESLLGKIAEIIVDRYRLGVPGISVGDVIDQLKAETGWDRVRPQTISGIIRKELHLKTKRGYVEGRREYWIQVSPEEIKKLSEEFDLREESKREMGGMEPVDREL
jgi:hypothetical protein